MKIGIVGYQGSGKSTLFHWLTGIVPDPALAHAAQSAMATIPEPRVDQLCEIYKPKKITQAALEIVDTPGLSRTHEGSAQKLAAIREAGALVIVVAGFGGGDPTADLRNFDDDLLIADLDILSGRVERLKDQLRKPRANKEKDQEELDLLVPILAELEAGKPLHSYPLSPEQRLAIKSFQLFSEKPRLIIVNTADDEGKPMRFQSLAPAGTELFAFSVSLQMDLAAMSAEERDEFCREMQVQPADRDHLIRRIMHASGQMIFFTAGEKEVRTWLLRQGGTAVEAAGGIHTDLARGFIRAETMSVADIVRLGSEREIKAAGLMRQEPKDYVIQDGDIINIKHSELSDPLETESPEVLLFTDGACSGNPGPGGWAYILRHVTTGKNKEAFGAERETTNNRMELQAVIEGLTALKRPCHLELFTDSEYVRKGLSEWMAGWKRNGWQRREKGKLKPVANADLWQQLDTLIAKHRVKFTRVAGHSGHPENDRCDQLAVEAYQQYR